MTDETSKRLQIPTDAQVIREFIAEAEAIEAGIKASDDNYVAGEKQGNAEARRALASRLEYVKDQRAAAVEDAAQQLAEAIAGIGKRWGNLLRGYDQGETVNLKKVRHPLATPREGVLGLRYDER